RMRPRCLEKLQKALDDDPPAEAVFGGVSEFVSPDLSPADAAGVRAPLKNVPSKMPTAMLIRREAFMKVGPFSTARRASESLDWYSRAMAKGLRHTRVEEVLWERRLHAGHYSSTLDYAGFLPQMLKDRLDARRRLSAG
ncbi:MAG: hypothetical protein ACRDIA_03680, partial [Actinomycetota bacterium]